MTIPYVKKRTFPSLKVQAVSSVSKITLKLFGDSAFIFILFYLKKVLELFIKNIPVPLKQCYDESSESTAHSTDSKDTEKDEEAPAVKRVYKRIVKIKSIKRKLSPNKDSAILEKRENKTGQQKEKDEKCENGLKKNSSDHLAPRVSFQTLPESGRPVFKKKRKVTVFEDLSCIECALQFVAANVESIVETDFMELKLSCTRSCVRSNQPDALTEFLSSISKLIGQTNLVNKDSTKRFFSNFERIALRILDAT